MALSSIVLGILLFLLITSIVFGIHSLVFLAIFNNWFGPG